MERWAEISRCGRYRYWLGRDWSNTMFGRGPTMVFVMLNPSTADHEVDDPTIRRCINFAKREGCDGLWVINLFALRATNPDELKASNNPIGPRNRRAWAQVTRHSTLVAAWGAHPMAKAQAEKMFALPYMRRDWKCLGLTKDGAPKHPLYLPKDAPLIDFKLAKVQHA